MARITYQGMRVKCDEIPEPTQCEVCKRVKGEQIKQLQKHHFLYKYSKKKVKENPKLAFENTVALCYPDHRLADALRTIYDSRRWNLIPVLINTMPPKMRKVFIAEMRELCLVIGLMDDE